MNKIEWLVTKALSMTDNTLYYGDNLDILRQYIKDETVDLIYLDPPFNSKRNYHLLFKTPAGHESEAQVTAFVDSWHWGEQAEQEFADVIHQGSTRVAAMLSAFRSFLGENDVMAYLAMMANRLLELHRVLNATGSIYLHCDPTASHYLKLIMDAVFGADNFQNEIIWSYKRYTATSHRFQRLHDVILFYTRNKHNTFNDLRIEYGDNSGIADSHYKQDEEGNWYRLQKRKGQEPYKIALSEGRRLGDVWDIPLINASAKERLGYPTQKPVALLERIINASSKPGDVVLDPFCGCGTAIYSAQSLAQQRKWIGIDITHLAVTLIEKRLRDSFPDIEFDVIGTPRDIAAARDLALRNKYQFQYWACSLVNAHPFEGGKKGADGGVDGMIFFQDDAHTAKKIIVSVKGGGNVGVSMIRDLRATVERQRAEIGIFITLSRPTAPMITEAASAGFYHSPISNANFPKLQILTIEGLLNGTEFARYPDLAQGGLTCKKSDRVKKITPNPA
jgi:site-specific DNA-methyltransferase (adenine-specific)